MPDNTAELTDAEIAQIEARANAATPEPWTSGTNYQLEAPWPEQVYWFLDPGDGLPSTLADCGPDPEPEERYSGRADPTVDAEFISNSRTDIPRLLATIRAEREKLRLAEGDLHRFRLKIAEAIGCPYIDEFSLLSIARRLYAKAHSAALSSQETPTT